MPTVVMAHEDEAYTQPEQEILQQIGADYIFERDLNALLNHARLGDVTALMVGADRVSKQLIDGMTSCIHISRVGTGIDSIDIPAATVRGIQVTNVPDFSVDEVSNHALALLLAQARRLRLLYDQSMRGVWDPLTIRPFNRLQGQTVGVLAFGRIGQTFASKARGMGLNVIAHDAYLAPDAIRAAGATPVSWQELLQQSDYISLHAPLNDSTYHIINADTLAQMKPNAYLVNTARGGLVDANALVEAVRNKKIAGAALDVFETEPLPQDSPLWDEENILVTPHVAWYSEDSMRDVKIRAAEEVVRVVQGKPPRCPVNSVKA